MLTKERAGTQSEGRLLERARRVLAPCICGSNTARLANPLMPVGTPQFFTRAKGARLWGVDGREYLDFLCGYGPNLFGYGEPRIEAAAQRQRALGDTMTGPAPVMIDLAERLVAMISHADWVLFAKNGVDVTSAALRVARAHTGKRMVLVASGSYHGAHPWCVPASAGVISEERAHRTEYRYNDVSSLESAVAEAGADLAAIFATAFRHDTFVSQEWPTAEYARRCRELCDRTGAVLVVDDIRAGFRLARDCSWSTVGIQPDLSCWSKVIANGYALSALLGSNRVRDGAKDVFLSGTYWLQAVPMAASLATLELIQETQYLEHTVTLGEMLRHALDESASRYGFELRQSGPVQMPMIQFEDDPDFTVSMRFASEMIQRGVYMVPYHNLFLCSAMTESDIRQTIQAAESVFAEMRKTGDTDKH